MVNIGRLGDNSSQIARQLLSETNVATAPGTAFGSSMNVRISLAAKEEDIRIGVERVCQAATRRVLG